jgi:preprotein translocase subunit SecE
MIVQTKAFINDVSKEMKKVSWPDKEKLRASTVVVIVATLLITGIVAIIDFAMSQVMSFIY